MIKKLLRALSKVPGLGSLRRFVEEPVASETRRDGTRTSGPRAPEVRQPLSVERTPPATAAGREADRSVRPSVAASTGKLAVAAAGGAPGAGSSRGAEPAAEFRQPPPDARQRPGPLASPAPPAEQRLGLAAVGPGRAFVFWELSGQVVGRARQYLGARNGGATAVVLRVHDITLVDFDGSNARRTMDLSMGNGNIGNTDTGDAGTVKGRSYLDLWTGELDRPTPGRIYCELGVQDSDGDFVAVAWSPILDLPIMTESPCEPFVRALVNGKPDAPWHRRLEPRASGSPRLEAGQGAAGNIPDPGEPSIGFTTDEAPLDVIEDAPSSGGDRAPGVDLPASARWTFSAPSSSDLLSGRSRLPSPAGLSSGLLARRRRS